MSEATTAARFVRFRSAPWIRLAFLGLSVVFAVSGAQAIPTPVQGEVYGEWTPEGSPYVVVNNLIVPPGQGLIIHPGVEVQFQGYYALEVRGFLSAVGSQNPRQRVVFTSDSVLWRGIIFNQGDNRSLLSNCSISNAWIGVDCRSTGLRVLGCEVTAANVAVSCDDASPEIAYCRLSVSGQGQVVSRYVGVSIVNGSSPVIHDNSLIKVTATHGDAVAIAAEGYSTPSIYHNWLDVQSPRLGIGIQAYQVSKLRVHHNVILVTAPQSMVGISLEDATGVDIFNNNVRTSGSSQNIAVGIRVDADARANVINNIIIGNYYSYGVRVAEEGEITYDSGWNDFFQQTLPVYGEWPNHRDTNIDDDPQFADDSMRLGPFSPCIDAGNPDWLDPDGSRSDIGRHYWPHPVKVDDEPVPTSSDVVSVYPNPFNTSTTITFAMRQAGLARLGVFDLAGKELKTFGPYPLSTGRHQFMLNGGGLPAGVYILRLQAGAVVHSTRVFMLP